MTKCERLQALLEEAEAEGNTALADAMRKAQIAAGCVPSGQGGANGNGPPDGNG